MMNKDNRNNKIRKIAKKGLTLSLCAVLAGGLAAGSFEGINKITGTTTVEAANKNDTTLTYAKSEKKADKDDSDSKADNSKDTADSSNTSGSLDVSDIAAEALPSIVSITTKSVQEVQSYYGMYGMYGYAPQQQEQEVEGSGSGIIVGKNDDELLIATNYHVVEDADTLSVAFVDGNAVEASVKGFDEEKDLAVVSVSLDDIDDDTMDAISVAKIGSSDDLKVGEQVVAIGNALGYGQSVTTGIVSAKNRRMDSDNNTVTDDSSDDTSDGVNLIQTDAAINPGNSGGALLNMEGEVVGINSAKLASTEVEGMGYAIAISDVTDILENLMNETSRDKLDDADHGVLGITGGSVSSDVVQMYGIPAGIFVKEVTEGGAADKAGLKPSSVITKFNGKSVSSIEQLIEYLSYYEPGEDVELTVEVPDGTEYKEETITVTLDKNTNTDDSKNSKKDKKDKKDSKDDGDDSDENTDSDDESDEEENPFIEYFQSQGFFR